MLFAPRTWRPFSILLRSIPFGVPPLSTRIRVMSSNATIGYADDSGVSFPIPLPAQIVLPIRGHSLLFDNQPILLFASPPSRTPPCSPLPELTGAD